MDNVGSFFSWLFGTTTGVIWLIGGGILLFLIIAFVLERKTRKLYHNHERSEDDWELFDDESGWSDFEDDNK